MALRSIAARLAIVVGVCQHFCASGVESTSTTNFCGEFLRHEWETTQAQLLRGPASDAEASAWRKNMSALRKSCKESFPFEHSALDEPALQWAQTSYVQAQMHPYDRYFYDDSLGNYTASRFLHDLSDRYGGIDSLILWPTYTNLGVDDRNQIDMFRALPGGIARLTDLVAELKLKHQVRVLLPYNPWDNATRREGIDDPQAMAQLLKDLGADGFFADTMLDTNRTFYDAGQAQGLNLGIEPEVGDYWTDESMASSNYTVLRWGYWGMTKQGINAVEKEVIKNLKAGKFDMWDVFGHFTTSLPKVPGVEFYKWAMDSRQMTHACQRFSSNKTDYLQVSFFNGVGFESWENVWGIWNQMTDRDAEALRRSATILRFFGKHHYLQSRDWQPHTAAKEPSDAVFVSEFPKNANDRVFLAVNRAGRPASAALFLSPSPANGTLECFDCYRGTKCDGAAVHVQPKQGGVRISFEVEIGGFACILVTNNPPDNLAGFLQSMAAMTVKPLSQFTPVRIILPQTMVAHNEPSALATTKPPGMVEVPTNWAFNFEVSGTEYEPLSRGFELHRSLSHRIAELPKGLPDWLVRKLLGTIPVDVQFPWEQQPTKYHEKWMHISRFFIDKNLVSVQDYAAYLAASGYVPADTHNWLKNWNHSTNPPTPPNGKPPVTYVSLREARAFCAFHGRRLPHDWEWQYAAQGPLNFERRYPWGYKDDPSMRPRVQTNGTLHLAEDVGRYPQAASPFGVEDLVGHVWQFTDEFYDNHTRAVLLRGGSYYRPDPQTVTIPNYYFPDASRLDRHSKYFLMSDSYERCGTIGFRCVADTGSESFEGALIV